MPRALIRGLGCVLAWASLGVAGSAVAAGQAPAASCFLARDVDNFAPVDNMTVNVRVGPSRTFQLKLFAPCTDLDFSQTIAMQTRGSSWICEGQANDVELFTRSPAGPQRCLVTSVRKLTDEEVKALPKGQKP